MIKQEKPEVYLTIHGHFYQPPRENPWLDYIEEQESASPFANWNARIDHECYTPNSVARITDQTGKILDIVNNYSLLSFNFGPTLISWIEEHSPVTYKRILKADKESQKTFSGHGSAIAQVYNHIIMPHANYQDKYTQAFWGIKDFEYRFERKTEGIWLSETAVCYETLEVLIDLGIKYTILSPYQADKAKYTEELGWQDVSRGNIDPARAYRCYPDQKNKKRYIDLFFYDGSISKSVAFEGVLYNGDKLADRIKDGIVKDRNYPQLVHISTDGESYGHHKPFGDMSLAYALKARLLKEDLKLTNYGEYLEKYPPTAEVRIKEHTSWSCAHGTGRWKEDCGCSTGGQPGWNQKWRKPLRKSLDWLNNELSLIYQKEAQRYFENVWDARNNYIDVLINRTSANTNKYFDEYSIRKLSDAEKENALKLLEMQKNAMFMFTSCGWFFTELSGIETVQILKYAARAMQLAASFSQSNLEEEFLDRLSEAKSNIKEFGNGRDIYKKFVKPSVVSRKQIVSHWAISSLFRDAEDFSNLYCYKIHKHDYIRTSKGSSTITIGRIELTSKLTRETSDMIFGLLHFGEENFHCVVRGFAGSVEYNRIKEDLINKFNNAPLTEVIRGLDEHFGKEYKTLKDMFFDEKRKIARELIKDRLEEFSTLYYKIYNDSQSSIKQLHELGLPVPDEFKIAARYTLSRQFNESVRKIEDISNIELFKKPLDILKEAKILDIDVNKTETADLFREKLTENMKEFSNSMEIEKCSKIINIIEAAERLDIKIKTNEAQNIYFSKLNDGLTKMIKGLGKSSSYQKDREFISEVLKLGEKLNFNLDKYYALLSKNLVTANRLEHSKL